MCLKTKEGHAKMAADLRELGRVVDRKNLAFCEQKE
jgi:hypothetical protein